MKFQFVSNLRDLFHQPSEEAYKNKLDELKMKWSDTFSEYYFNSIHPEVSIQHIVLCSVHENFSETLNHFTH